MDDDRAAALAVELASLAGREIGAQEARAVVIRARGLTAAQARRILARHRCAPRTVALRDYLAVMLRFVEQDPPPDRGSELPS